jgi:hypothetical protein
MDCMNSDRWLAGAGIVIGCLIALWQWRAGNRKESEAKKRGDILVGFLHGLKGETLTGPTLDQVNDMLGRLDPPATSKTS